MASDECRACGNPYQICELVSCEAGQWRARALAAQSALAAVTNDRDHERRVANEWLVQFHDANKRIAELEATVERCTGAAVTPERAAIEAEVEARVVEEVAAYFDETHDIVSGMPVTVLMGDIADEIRAGAWRTNQKDTK